MRARTWRFVLMTTGLLVTACSSSSGSSHAAGTTATTSAASRPATTAPPTIATTTTLPPPSSTSAAAQNLVVTDDVRAQLVQAGAAQHNLPASAYTGLAPGFTYYAFDPATATYWAGAKLVPSTSSLPAQVSVQDDGAYDIFMRSATGTWSARTDGMGGIGGTACLVIPPPVLAVWHWPPGTCRPPA